MLKNLKIFKLEIKKQMVEENKQQKKIKVER